MSDEIRLISQMTGSVYENSVGNKISIIKIENNVMMTAKEIAKLYGVSRVYVTQMLQKLFKSGEFNKKAVSNRLSHRASDGKLYETRYYNHDIIIALGRFVKSNEAEPFKNWIGARLDLPKQLS
jgi:hypothetical protein